MFGEPEIRFGSASANVVLPWIVPIKIAKELLYTGKLITAQRAYEVGMVNEVVPRGDLERRARYYASLVAEISPAAVHTLKAAVNRSYELMGMQQALDFNFNLVAILAGSDTEEKRQFREMARSKGVKAALAWRAAQFAELEREW